MPLPETALSSLAALTCLVAVVGQRQLHGLVQADFGDVAVVVFQAGHVGVDRRGGFAEQCLELVGREVAAELCGVREPERGDA